MLAGARQALEPVVDGLHLEALRAQAAGDGVGQADLVLHEQHAHATSVAVASPGATSTAVSALR